MDILFYAQTEPTPAHLEVTLDYDTATEVMTVLDFDVPDIPWDMHGEVPGDAFRSRIHTAEPSPHLRDELDKLAALADWCANHACDLIWG